MSRLADGPGGYQKRPPPPLTAFEEVRLGLMANRVTGGIPAKGTPNRRIISTFEYGDREYSWHATKGFRSRKVVR